MHESYNFAIRVVIMKGFQLPPPLSLKTEDRNVRTKERINPKVVFQLLRLINLCMT